MTRIEIKTKAKEQLGNGIFETKWLVAVVIILIITAIFSLFSIPLLGTVAMLLLAGPLYYGLNYVFLKQSRDGNEMQICDLFSGFNDFTQNFLIFLMTGIFTFLWSLLLVVPGIIKALSYSMVYFIKADHPEYDWHKCIDESKRIMFGHKWDYFVLNLSFIGWSIVGALCLGLGTLWVQAYISAAHTHFYESIK